MYKICFISSIVDILNQSGIIERCCVFCCLPTVLDGPGPRASTNGGISCIMHARSLGSTVQEFPHKFQEGHHFFLKNQVCRPWKKVNPGLEAWPFFRYLWTKLLWWKRCNSHNSKIWNLAPGLHGGIWGVAPRDRWFFEVCVGVARRWGPYYSYK